MDLILDNMQQICCVNNLHMAVLMHEDRRRYKSPESRTNPARGVREAEDARVTFFSKWERYGVIKPLRSDVKWIAEKDWLKLMVDACRQGSLSAGAEVSHFRIPKTTRRGATSCRSFDMFKQSCV